MTVSVGVCRYYNNGGKFISEPVGGDNHQNDRGSFSWRNKLLQDLMLLYIGAKMLSGFYFFLNIFSRFLDDQASLFINKKEEEVAFFGNEPSFYLWRSWAALRFFLWWKLHSQSSFPLSAASTQHNHPLTLSGKISVFRTFKPILLQFVCLWSENGAECTAWVNLMMLSARWFSLTRGIVRDAEWEAFILQWRCLITQQQGCFSFLIKSSEQKNVFIIPETTQLEETTRRTSGVQPAALLIPACITISSHRIYVWKSFKWNSVILFFMGIVLTVVCSRKVTWICSNQI